ncbi:MULTISPECIES: YheC/YheD family protein [unclassified Paenibacillus]|uniref:YheC/YheD family endospore coat-associated protein n=1 Tax=unclassified Paenibacillus TaxID=185978 RepID=UPI00278441A3|nr:MULTISPECIES: YheC/YheD family protein [unclassified Paenibacillus]MDQ0897007.1 antitoxin component of MazEF toxin-antitoxin module [Paenibacillus sp. V4I7]MDQ0916846.1 antitoxin component of MazEF toxin-antitoxin module [Paenibacillus sp. V4I5]
MSLTTCMLHAVQRTDRSVYLTSELVKALRLTGNKSITVKVGSKKATLPIRLIKKSGQHMYIPLSLMASLRIPRTGSVFVASNNNKELRIGPVIGILTNVMSGTSPFGSKTGFIRQVMSTASSKSFAFAFSPSSVNWTQETVTGIIPKEGGGWIRKTFPLPDVVYNRLSSRKAEKSAGMEGFKDRFVRRGIPLFNWSFFDKWDVYKMLDGDDAFRFVPESRINPSADQIKEMLDKHKFIYLKPTAGSLGIGIFRVTYNPKRGYFVRYRKAGKNVLIRYGKFDGLMQMLGTGRGRLTNYVAQQGIRLIEIDSCPIDFRFHLTKNGNNNWVVAAIGAKKSGKGSVTTHIRNGGQLMTPEQVLRQIYGTRAEQVLTNAKETAIKLAEGIENNYNHLLGELGFDIGIDQSEKIWMFEANAKPGRSIFKHPSLKEGDVATLQNIYEHCLFLSRFRSRREN